MSVPVFEPDPSSPTPIERSPDLIDGGQPTNLPPVAMADAADGIVINRTEAPTAADIILKLQQSGADKVWFWPDGSAYFGTGTYPHFGSPAGEFGMLSPLVAYQDTTAGGYDATQIYFVNTNGTKNHQFDVFNGTSQSFVACIGNGPSSASHLARFKVEVGGNSEMRLTASVGVTSASVLIAVPETGAPTMSMSDHNGAGLSFSPGAAVSANPYTFDTTLTHTSGDLVQVKNKGSERFAISFEGKVRTAAPSGNGAGAWRLGKKVTATVSAVTTDYIEVEIDGVVYKLGLVS